MLACVVIASRDILRELALAVRALSTMDDEQATGPKRPDELETVRLEKPELVFNHYHLLSELGRGGTGVVWLARDLELNTNVALKFLREDVAFEAEAIRELKGEIILNRDLSHPHIIKTYNFETNGQRAAIAMEHVSGDNLQTLKAQQPGKFFNVEDIFKWMQMLCDAMDYAHRQHVVHRDIKPSNLMINQHGELKVGDFGIGRAVAETVNRLTKNAAGTPPYMSPQQTMGEKAIQSDDIYSIGATIYDLLTGSPPFFRGAIREQALAKVPPSMAQRRIELERAGAPIPPQWEKTVAACLAKEPAARPPTARALREMLEGKAGSVLSGYPARSQRGQAGGVESTETTVLSGYPLARGVSRWYHWVIAGVALLGIVGGVVVWKDPRQMDRLRAALTDLKGWAEKKTASAPAPVPVAPVEVLPEKMEIPQPVELAPNSRDPLVEKIGALVAAGDVTALEAGWLQSSLKGTNGEAEKSLAERLVDLKLVTLGQWRARTAHDYSLREEVPVDGARLPPALDLPLNEWTRIRLLRMDAGIFFRGSPRDELGRRPNELPPEQVTIAKPFFIGIFEVTQAEYNALMVRDPSFWRGNPTWPVDQIDWQSVAGPNGFIAKLNRDLAGKYGGLFMADLPTEDEWEYACRAGTRTAFNSSVNISKLESDPGLDPFANYNRAASGTPRPVGSFQPNAWGLFDLHGNVAEWCQNRFQRGGSWQSTAANCRSAWRTQLSANAAPSNQVGFRLVIRHRRLPQSQ